MISIPYTSFGGGIEMALYALVIKNVFIVVEEEEHVKEHG